ncbi:hypothetical protein BSKO_07667 [Bryopsis sp. KO-2023]|nr:hypothetical protein BSKO_07667 [Bryopsis sp. KO-2023]
MVRKPASGRTSSPVRRSAMAWQKLEKLGLFAKGDDIRPEKLKSNGLTWIDLKVVSICHFDIIPELSNTPVYDVGAALGKLAQLFPESALPHRYKARIVHHQSNLATGSRAARLQMLSEAYDSSVTAASLSPNSLSCVALKSTLVVSRLVEKATVISRKGLARTRVPTESECTEIQEELVDAMDSIRKALSGIEIVREPPIYLSVGGHWSFDPCCLRVRDRMHPVVQMTQWDKIVHEKRSFVKSMLQLLESCRAVLDNVKNDKVPMESVVRLLHHILRPHQPELQLWANHIVPSKNRSALENLHRKFETHQAVAQLLSALRPNKASDSSARSIALPSEHHPSTAMLSLERDWDSEHDVVKARRVSRVGRGASKSHRKPRTRKERYMDVEGFWTRASKEKRREVLKVPLISCLDEVRMEQGMEATEEMADSLLMLKDHGSQRACYWICPACDQKYRSSKDYVNHIDLFHEELAVVENNYIRCSKCQKEIVGMYYSSLVEDCFACINCYHKDVASSRPDPALRSCVKVFPQPSAEAKMLTTTDSDIMGTQSSCALAEESASTPMSVGKSEEEKAMANTEKSFCFPLGTESELEADTRIRQLFHEAQIGSEGSSVFMVPDGDDSHQDGSENGSASRGWKGWWPKRLTFALGRSSKKSQAEGGCSQVQEPAHRPLCNCSSSHSGTQNADEDDHNNNSNNHTRNDHHRNDSGTCSAKTGGKAHECPVASLECKETSIVAEKFLFGGSESGTARDEDAEAVETEIVPSSEESSGAEDEEEGFDDEDNDMDDVLRSRDQLIAIILNRMRRTWFSEKSDGEVAIGNVSYYIQCKIECMLEEEQMDEETKGEVHQAMQDFIPNMILKKTSSVRAVLNCLSFRELKIIGSYLYQRHYSDIPIEEEDDLSIYGDDSYEDSDEDDEDDDDMPGCLSLFKVSSDLNEEKIDRIIEILWEREDPQDIAEIEGDVVKPLSGLDEGSLEVQEWWLDHLTSNPCSAGSSGGDPNTAVLRWVYGNIVNSGMEQFIELQKTLRGGKDRDAAIIDLLGKIADKWRHVQAYTDKRNWLDEFRKGAKLRFGLARELAKDPKNCSGEQACKYLDAVAQSCGGNLPVERERPILHTSALVMEVVLENMQLTHESSHRYARALLERELSVLQVVEAMLSQTSNEYRKEADRAGSRLVKLKKELQETEAELERVDAEGPANHRRRDILDKATKEAEHREKLLSLTQKIAALEEKAGKEEVACGKWEEKMREACKDLTTVEEWLKQHSAHTKNLNEVCAQLGEPDCGGRKSAEKLECLLYRVLWVCEAIKLLEGRYTAGSKGKPYELFVKATRWMQKLAGQYEDQIRMGFNDLDELRQKLQTVACIDQAYDICGYSLEAVRKMIEEAARQARELASQSLLKELEEEAAKEKEQSRSASTSTKSSKKKQSKKSKAVQALKEKAERKKAQEEETAKRAEEVHKQREADKRKRLEEARKELDALHEAQLEQRRRELEMLAVQKELKAREKAEKEAAQASTSGKAGSESSGKSPSKQRVNIPVSKPLFVQNLEKPLQKQPPASTGSGVTQKNVVAKKNLPTKENSNAVVVETTLTASEKLKVGGKCPWKKNQPNNSVGRALGTESWPMQNTREPVAPRAVTVQPELPQAPTPIVMPTVVAPPRPAQIRTTQIEENSCMEDENPSQLELPSIPSTDSKTSSPGGTESLDDPTVSSCVDSVVCSRTQSAPDCGENEKGDSVRWCVGGLTDPSNDPVWQQVLAQTRQRRGSIFESLEPLSRHSSFTKESGSGSGPGSVSNSQFSYQTGNIHKSEFQSQEASNAATPFPHPEPIFCPIPQASSDHVGAPFMKGFVGRSAHYPMASHGVHRPFIDPSSFQPHPHTRHPAFPEPSGGYPGYDRHFKTQVKPTTMSSWYLPSPETAKTKIGYLPSPAPPHHPIDNWRVHPAAGYDTTGGYFQEERRFDQTHYYGTGG